MKNSVSKIIFLLLASFLFVSCSKEEQSENEIVSPEVVNKVYNYTSEETQLLALVNEYRLSVNLQRLEKIDFISYTSENHNLYMISQGAVSHNLFQDRHQALVQNLGAIAVSENIAYSYTTPQGALNAWLKSASHKINLDGDFTHFGISIRVNAEGKKYYTNIFIKK